MNAPGHLPQEYERVGGRNQPSKCARQYPCRPDSRAVGEEALLVPDREQCGTGFAEAGGLVIGIGQQVSTQWLTPAYKPAVAFAIMILILMVRPKGIFGGS